MIGPRVGSKAGPNVGPAVGIGADPVAFGGVTRDASSLKYAPSSSAEWQMFITMNSLAIGTPDSLYLCQDPNTGLADSIGAATLLASDSGFSFRQSVAGWSRLGAKTTDGQAGRFVSTDAALPDVSTTSCMVLFYAIAAATGANRSILEVGTTPAGALINLGPPNRYRVVAGGSTASAANDPSGAVRPYALRIRRDAGAPGVVAFSDQEKLSTTLGSIAGKRVQLGGSGIAGPANATYLYAARWDGTKAEISDATLKAVLQALGWTIPWT